MTIKECLATIAGQEKQFDALYRGAGAVFGYPDCAMWVLYYLTVTDEEMSQQDLIGKMMFPKQTINSAVSALAEKGLLELAPIPGTRNRKKISLTPAGMQTAEQTVGRMAGAEQRAAEKMGLEQMTQFIELHRNFYTCLYEEFAKEGLIHGEN